MINQKIPIDNKTNLPQDRNMSKQSDAKAAQGYVAKAVPETCVNCCHLKMDLLQMEGAYGWKWTRCANLRCGIGGFAVKKMATCKEWAPKPK